MLNRKEIKYLLFSYTNKEKQQILKKVKSFFFHIICKYPSHNKKHIFAENASPYYDWLDLE